VFGHDRALDITTDRITVYTAQRLKEDAKPASVNYELSILRRAFSLKVQSNRLCSRPWIALLEVDNARQGFISPSDFNRLVEALPEHLKDPVSFLYLSCWRPVEMKTLQWKDVDLKGRAVRLRVDHSKTKKSRLLKLDGRLLAILERAHAARRLDCPFVFHVEGRLLKDFSGSWKTARKEALLVYDLRRSGIRNLIRAGIPESVAMKVSGHKTRKMLDRYNIASEEDLDAASVKLDRYPDAQQDEPAKVTPLPLRIKS
jgi:integrase